VGRVQKGKFAKLETPVKQKGEEYKKKKKKKKKGKTWTKRRKPGKNAPRGGTEKLGTSSTVIRRIGLGTRPKEKKVRLEEGGRKMELGEGKKTGKGGRIWTRGHISRKPGGRRGRVGGQGRVKTTGSSRGAKCGKPPSSPQQKGGNSKGEKGPNLKKILSQKSERRAQKTNKKTLRQHGRTQSNRRSGKKATLLTETQKRTVGRPGTWGAGLA